MTRRSLLCESEDAVTVEWMQHALTVGAAFDSPRLESIAAVSLGTATNAFGSRWNSWAAITTAIALVAQATSQAISHWEFVRDLVGS